MSARESVRRVAVHECRVGGGEVAAAALCSISDAVVTTDVSGRIRFLNPAAEALLNLPYDQAQGRPLREVITIIDGASGLRLEDPVAKYLRKGEDSGSRIGQFDLIVRRDGSQVPIEDSTSLVRNARSEIVGTVMILRDMSATRRLVRDIELPAGQDPTARLVGRGEFELRLTRVLDAMQGQQIHALMLATVDGLARMGDGLGHDAAEAAVHEVAQLLAGRVRSRDTIGQVGAGRFGILLEHCPEVQAFRAAQALRRAVVGHGFAWQEQAFDLRLSVGLVPITGRRRRVQELLSAAETACETARQAGGDRVHVHQASALPNVGSGDPRSIGGGSAA